MLRDYQSACILFHYRRAKRELSRARRGRVILVIVLRRHRQSGRWEAASAWLRHRGRDFQIALSETHLMVLYCAVRSGVRLKASQIAVRMERYTHEVAGTALRSGRTAIRKQFQRIREALKFTLDSANLNLDPNDVVKSTVTSTNEVRYVINAVPIFTTIDG